MGHYFGAAYFGEYDSEGSLPVNPWIPACGEPTGDCRPLSLMDGLWPVAGDGRPPSVIPVPEAEPTMGHTRVLAGSGFGGAL